MKTEKNILIAFILNLAFSVFEFFGGIYTGSVAIISDSVHDMGDAASIGISIFFEKKSKKEPDGDYTFGYARYSLLGSFITLFILLCGSAAVISNALKRILSPAPINYDGMIIFAVAGVIINFCAAFFTRGGDSLNRRAVNLHMLEDTLSWAVVLVGAVAMKFTDIALIDPLMSIGVAVFIAAHTLGGLKEILFIFLGKTPENIDTAKIQSRIKDIDGVQNVRDFRITTTDGSEIYASVHIITDSAQSDIKEKVRTLLCGHGICQTTIEIQTEEEYKGQKCCDNPGCCKKISFRGGHCHRH